MDLTFDDETEAFRAEVRDFLASNREHFPTKSYDTLEGFEQHQEFLDRYGQLGRAQGVEEVDQHGRPSIMWCAAG